MMKNEMKSEETKKKNVKQCMEEEMLELTVRSVVWKLPCADRRLIIRTISAMKQVLAYLGCWVWLTLARPEL